MLERMWKPTQYSSDQWTTRGGVHWLSDFLRECQAMILDISAGTSTSQKIRESSFHDVEELSKADWTPAGVQRMVPFSLMMARIVELDSNNQIREVSDLWIKPNWDNFVQHGIEVEVSRIPMFANYEYKIRELLKISELLQDEDDLTQTGLLKILRKQMLDQLDSLDEEARSFITERDSWKKESSILKKAGLDLSKFIEETENEYWNPIIPSTFYWPDREDIIGNIIFEDPEPPVNGELFVEPYQSGYLDDGEWISLHKTRDRRPPVPFELAIGSSIQLDMRMSKEINSLMEVLRTTKIDYVEVPKESLEFFEDPDRATQKVTKITNNLDTSKIQMIEDKINEVLRMKGERDPWSRKVSLSETSSPVIHGDYIMGPARSDFDTKKERILQLQSKRRFPSKMHLKIEDLGNPILRGYRQGPYYYFPIPHNWYHLDRILGDTEDAIDELKEAQLAWKNVLGRAESNVVTFDEDFRINDYAKSAKTLDQLAHERQKLEGWFDVAQHLDNDYPEESEEFKDKQKELSKIQQEIIQVQAWQNQIISGLDLNSYRIKSRQYEGAKEQLILIVEIIDELQMLLAFFEEAYLILQMFNREEPESDVRGGPLESLDFLHTQLSHLGESSIWGLEQETLEQYQVPHKFRNKTMFEAYMYGLNRMKNHLEEARKTRFVVQSPYRKTPLRKDVLSFGQKSTILTELYLGTFEALSAQSSDIDEGSFNEHRYCLIIDEPEVGRSEYSLNLLITRLISSKKAHDAELNNSVVVLSHRNKLLKQVSGKYHLLQPVDIGYQTEEE